MQLRDLLRCECGQFVLPDVQMKLAFRLNDWPNLGQLATTTRKPILQEHLGVARRRDLALTSPTVRVCPQTKNLQRTVS